ncbi:hypothetical protein PRIPAC_72985 [Pristionchus pacificus]|uniref:Uncharacterized protein n=1 Tax=Pristionchus pacificus TaxID=54126 RepID=A0A2A6C9E8_PRIPA|nr:hypothetical protein PRIPAC_72985 [Pristionchus pacificus]|eukprot:PDM74804.1 hypothetical protein PRIPAC_43217 [Pristionchus pacificus]
MLSELIIASTLIVNAFAILNFKLTKSPTDSASEFVGDVAGRSIGDRMRQFLASLQYFRVFIAMWNIFLIFMMFM